MGYRRSIQEKKKLLQTYSKTKHKMRGVWYDDESDRYHKISYSKKGKNSYATFLRKHSNRTIRRNKLKEELTGNNYKKFYDYWWELF